MNLSVPTTCSLIGSLGVTYFQYRLHFSKHISTTMKQNAQGKRNLTDYSLPSKIFFFATQSLVGSACFFLSGLLLGRIFPLKQSSLTLKILAVTVFAALHFLIGVIFCTVSTFLVPRVTHPIADFFIEPKKLN